MIVHFRCPHNRELDRAVHARLRGKPARYPSSRSLSPLPSFDRGSCGSVLYRLTWNTRRWPHHDSRLGQKAIVNMTRTKLSAVGFRLSSACPCPSAT